MKNILCLLLKLIIVLIIVSFVVGVSWVVISSFSIMIRNFFDIKSATSPINFWAIVTNIF